MIIAWLGFFEGLLAVALFASGLVGAHWRYVPPFTGFQIFLAGFLFGIIAFVMALIGISWAQNPMRAAARPRAVIGTILGLFVIAPILWTMFTGPKIPAINDITTDFVHPPEFTHAQSLNANHDRNMKYDKDKYADRQLQGYGALDPLKMPERPDDAFKNVQRVASQMPDWSIISTDPKTRTIEGYATSQLFHFNDDFIIQVRPSDGGGSLLEMRSKSRDGIGDFGVNYKRIRSFFAAVSPDTTG